MRSYTFRVYTVSRPITCSPAAPRDVAEVIQDSSAGLDAVMIVRFGVALLFCFAYIPCLLCRDGIE